MTMCGLSAARALVRTFSGRRSSRQRGAVAGTRYPLHVCNLRLEPLEERTLLSAAASVDHGTATYYHTAVELTGAPSRYASRSMTPAATTVYYNPSQVRTAYGLNSIVGDGTGQTIAIVDAYKDTNIASELAYFDSYYGLPAANLTVVNQTGGTSLSRVGTNSGWALEIALDVEWAHAMAPGAKILLVCANNSANNNLMTAVDTAAHYTGVSVVSMSWGSNGEYSGETTYDSHFQVAGVTFVASTGDSGSPGGYPAYSPYVLAVGGTALTIDSGSSAYVSETGWSGSGGGTSSYESEPSYQTSVQSTGHRTIPDVSLIAADTSLVYVYYNSSWYGVYGTSVSAPCWAGILSIANQLRVASGLSRLNTASTTQTHALLYSLYASANNSFHDVTSGSNGGYAAGTGYDEVTGLGSPVANLLVNYLVQSVPTASPTLVSSYDSGASQSDNVTYYSNNGAANVLKFTVPGTVSGATVTIYADGTAIGSAAATGTSTTVTTSGTYTLADGAHAITAKQTESGKIVSTASSSLTITIDTLAPSVTINQAAGQVDPSTTSPINFAVVFSEAVTDFVAGDVTLGGTAGGTPVALATNPSGDRKTYNVAVSGMTGEGTVTASVAAGVAHDAAGNGNTASTSSDNLVTYTMSPPIVAGAVINDGNAQRSMVDGLTVTFSQIVTIDAGAFDVERIDTGGGPVTVAVVTQVVGGRSVATLTFSGALTQFNSLMDGSYELIVSGAKVRDAVTGAYLDGDSNGQPGGDYVFGVAAADHFFRKFGDVNGDQLVNDLDLAQFDLAYLNAAAYQWYFDFSNDGRVDALDFFQFKLRYSA
jgi:subtilase family serine protease